MDSHFKPYFEDEVSQIEVPLGTELIVQLEGVYGHLKSELVGQRCGHYLIIRTPVGPPGLGTKLFRGNIILIRYLHEGLAYGFQTTIINSVNDPEPLLFIACPRLVQERSLRAAKRLDTYLLCKVAVQAKIIRGTIIDISRAGCRVMLPSHPHNEPELKLHTGDILVIESELEGKPLRLPARIRNIGMFHAAIQVGVQFETLSKESEERLTDYLLQEGLEI